MTDASTSTDPLDAATLALRSAVAEAVTLRHERDELLITNATLREALSVALTQLHDYRAAAQRQAAALDDLHEQIRTLAHLSSERDRG